MLYTIQNDYLSVSISDQGAELQSIRSADGTEYLWQGDPTYWTDRSPVLFPYIGRMINKQYSYGGKVYNMDIHGFASTSVFTVQDQSQTAITFTLVSNEETMQQYPWTHRFNITYRLQENQLETTFVVENLDSTSMLFGVGGHPGFRVPLEKGLRFEDYRLRFAENCLPEQILFSSDCFVLPQTKPFPLVDGKYIPLTQDMFDSDAIVLTKLPRCIVLESERSERSVTVSFPDMAYVGLWHMPHTDAPYICIEPWSSLPSAKKEKTVWEDQTDLITLESGKTYTNTWTIRVK